VAVNVIEATRAVTEVFPDAVLVPSLGTATSATRLVTDDGAHFYFGAAMGSTLAAALGLAEAVPGRQVVAVLGDGDCLMGASTVWSVSAYRPLNLLVVVLVDGTYSITGGQPVAPALRLARVADALDGLTGATADSVEELRAVLGSIQQPGIVEARIAERTWPGPSPFVDPAEVVRGVRRSVGAPSGNLDARAGPPRPPDDSRPQPPDDSRPQPPDGDEACATGGR
jgi:thiamine pyrophosphate-dependent acetolactate synthase large subunit-like protein